MIVNGNLKFHTVGLGELQNVVIETMTTTEKNAATHADGRIVFDTTLQTLYFSRDTGTWEAVGDSGTITTLIASMGVNLINADGTYDATNMDLLTNVSGSLSLYDAIADLDAAIDAAAGADSIATLTDTTITGPAADLDVLQYNSGTSRWVDRTLLEAGIQAQDAVLDDISALAVVGASTDIIRGTGVAGTYEYFTVTAAGYALLDDATAAAQRTTLGLVIGTNVQAYDLNLDQIAALAPVANSFIVGSGAGTWGLETPVDALISLGLTATAAEVNILDGVLNVTAAEISFLSEVTSDIQAQFTGKQAADAALTALSALAGTGIVVQTGVDTFIVRSVVESTTNGLVVTNGDGVAGNPSLAIEAGLDSIAGLTMAANTMIYATADNVFASTPLTAAGRALIDDASATAQRTTLGLGSAALSATTDFLSGTASDNILTGSVLTVDSGGSITIATGGDITAVDAPTTANDLTNKAYVDALVAAGASWKNPVLDSDLVDIISVNPAAPEADYGLGVGDNVSFIVTASIASLALGTGTTVASAVAGDIVNLTITSAGNGDYTIVNTPLASGDRFIVGAEHGSALGIIGGALGTIDIGADNVSVADGSFVIGDTYTITLVGDTDFTLIGATANTVGVSFVATGVGGAGTGTADDITNNIKKADLIQFTGTGTGTTASSWSFPDGRSGLAAGEVEIAQGVTVLNSDPESVHYGHSFLYNAAGDEWVEISGPGSIGAGTGLSYTGNTLNIGMGAGIIALPADEVGVDIHASGGLITTVDGTNSSTVTASQLGIKLNGTTLALAAGGLSVGTILNANVDAAAAIAYSKLATLASANILVGSAGGVATSVVMGGDISISNTGVTTIGALKVATGMLQAGSVTLAKMADITDGSFLMGNNTGAPVAIAMSGDVTMTNAGVTTIGALKVATGMIQDDAVTLLKMANMTEANFIVGNATLVPTLVAMSGDVTMIASGLTTIGTNAVVTTNITDANVTNAKLANSSFTINADTGSDEVISLGNTLILAGGTGIDTVGSATDTVTLNLNAAITDLSNVVATSTTGGETLVSNGTNFVNRKIYHVYNSTMVSEVSTIATVAEATNNYDDTYFLISSTGVDYYFWFNSAAAGTDPAPAGKTLGGVVAVADLATADTIASSIQAAVNGHAAFTASVLTNTVTITAVLEGDTTNANAGTSPVTAGTTTQGGIPATSHTVTHNIGQQYCNVTVVDSTDEMIIPESVFFNSNAALTVTFNSSIDCRVIVMGINPGA